MTQRMSQLWASIQWWPIAQLHFALNSRQRWPSVQLHSLQEFFRLYPELSTNDFYIVGESYAGVYIPMLAQRILNRPNNLSFKAGALLPLSVASHIISTWVASPAEYAPEKACSTALEWASLLAFALRCAGQSRSGPLV